jgi:uncharacterized SAM-binding protein YcdF (DUF218 family)
VSPSAVSPSSLGSILNRFRIFIIINTVRVVSRPILRYIIRSYFMGIIILLFFFLSIPGRIIRLWRRLSHSIIYQQK